MGILKNLIKNSEEKAEFKEKLKNAQQESKINRLIEERQKSSNRRELERYIKEQEEMKIKQTLDQIRKKNNKEMWKSENLILAQPATMLNEDRPILKEKNIFHNNQNMFTKKHSIKNKTDMGFFKW